MPIFESFFGRQEKANGFFSFAHLVRPVTYPAMTLENLDAPDGGEPAAHARSEGKMITMATIAKAAGVSQGAISSLLNDRDYGIRVSAKTRERVFRVCREMGYMPNDLRAVVRMYPELGDFALLVSKDIGLDEPFADSLARALLAHIPEGHLSVASYDPALDYTANPAALPRPLANGVASKFILLGAPNASLFAAIVVREIPAIHIGPDSGTAGVTCLLPDYAHASRQAIETFFALGHKQIAILSGPFGSTDPMVIELNFGVRAAYDGAKIPIEAQNVIYGDSSFEHGIASINLLLDRAQKPTAVFCFSPVAAAGVIHGAQLRGVQIPRELSVISFGDAAFAPLLHPPLATVSIAAHTVATKAIEELHGRIKAQDYTAARRFIIAANLIERASSSPLNEP